MIPGSLRSHLRGYLRAAVLVFSRVSLGPDGLTNITGICEGTNVGNLQYYLDRKRMTNDFHGLGAFLIMNEEWNTSVASQRLTPHKDR